MNRNQIFTTIEFIDDLIRMSIGEYYNEKFYIFDTFKCRCNGLEASNIVDVEEVKRTINELINLIKEKTEIIVEELILCLPSEHLIINDITSTAPVTGKNSLISSYDINEAFKVASKIRHNEDETVINIVPIEYQIDDGQKMDFAPIRYKSTTFKTLFNVFMLPTNVFDSYINAISECNLKIDKYYLDADCLYAGIFDEDDISSSVLNLDKYSCSLMLYKKGKLLNKISIPFGTSTIEDEVIKELQIREEKTLKNMIYNVGACVPSENKYLSVCKNSENRYISEQKLNEVIERSTKAILNNLISNARNVIEMRDLDVYITGYGANINGIDKLLNSLCECNATIYVSNVLGLNNSSYCETIGLIKLNYKKISQNKYMNLQNNNYNDIMVNKEKNSKFDKFILDEEELD